MIAPAKDDIRISIVRFGDRKALQMQTVSPHTGKKITRTAGTNKMSVALQRAAEWREELKRDEFRPRVRIDFEELVWRYCAATKAGDDTCRALDRFEGFIGVKPLYSITLADLLEFKNYLRKKKCSERLVASSVRGVAKCLGWAAKEHLILPTQIEHLGAFCRSEPKEAFVYFILCPNKGEIKIGWASSSKCVSNRFQAVRTHNADDPELLGVLPDPGDRSLEKQLHDHTFPHLRIRGEWFRDATEIRVYLAAELLRHSTEPMENPVDDDHEASESEIDGDEDDGS